ncbi:class I SAM-dependent methyltransferase [Pseudoalteromonas piscicida]|uniref:class I SAM-dependent methyltransferase n=1 Tax=Pseudoalteromonas TaxID=53246 RepID=UPI00157225D3|nr:MULTISPECIES: class I SAM-dependent methyltransferase [Pseudoalteromonas]MCG7552486.1 class I SAM-dependent methyltransferase [Pseudoalteromonas sp. Of11M-6]NSY32141.1 class I SAM-dependent methyltransferase [Pseudoalteromonas sp. JC28]UDM62202.1 class I SAM-dependent methyltransferase [Pseudoalteromonas piscicida]
MSWDKTWEDIFKSQAWGKYPGEDIVRFIARNYYKCEDRCAVKLLEIGCGPGANIWFMAREGFNVTGIDGSKTAIAQAKARLDHEVPDWQGHLDIGDMIKLPYSDKQFDCVLDIEASSTNSFENTQKIYQEAARVLKPNGLLYIRTFATGTWGDKTGEQLAHNTYIPQEGPMAAKGLTRFTDEEDIVKLLPTDMKLRNVDLLQWGRGVEVIKEWMIIAQKEA